MKTRRLFIWIVLLAFAGGSTVVAQTSSQPPLPPDSPDDPTGNHPSCPDGSSPISMSTDSFVCQITKSKTLGETSGADNPQSSTAGTAEKADITERRNARTSNKFQPPPPEQLTEFQKFVASTTGQLLPIFGARLFRNVPSTFSPNDLAPVTSDYAIGPDDELRIRIWGQVNYSGNLRVDRSGNIYLPEIGEVNVAGLQFSALDQRLRSAAARVYRNFDLSVDMGRIRSIQIYVAGQARQPGAYTVSSLSSLVDALFASGGPSAQGSLRHIELRRNGKTIVDFDLYALLIHGDKSRDTRLLPEDVLYIPPMGSEVAVFGSVRNPGIYEARDQETIGDLLEAAGKVTAVAANARISIERAGEHQSRQAMEVNLDANGEATRLAAGDIVRVYAILPAYANTVTLRGYVVNPGRFAWHPGMHVSDVIPDRDSLLSRDYWWKRSHLGLPSQEFEPFLSNLEANQENRASQVPSPSTPMSQESRDPDPLSPSTQQAFTRSLSASNSPGTVVRTDTGGLQDQRTNGSGGAIAAQGVQTPNISGSNPNRKVDVHISAPDIDWNYAVIERIDPQTFKSSLESFDLGKLVLNHDASQDLALQPGDTITVFSQADIRVPVEEQTKYVRLEGEFNHAGIYSVRPGETLRDLVARAGGITPKGYLYGSEFDRESTRILQQQRIDEYVRRADLDASRGTLALTASPVSSSSTVTGASAATAAEQELLVRLKQIRATGRIVLNFPLGDSSVNSLPAISLEDGDRFTVPPTPATINVVGAVYDQNSFLYRTGGTAGRYLQVAGGPDRDADWRRTFVIRANGSVVNRLSVNGLWGNDFKHLRLYPGDTIVVPDRSIRPTALRGLLDWTQIFSQLAIGAAAVNVLR